jgi:hypothetical protein
MDNQKHRCIVDMKQVNQNAAIGKDPVPLYQSQDTLPLLFPKGYMAVLDASKYFHMFLTLLRERHLLGILHPETNEAFWWERLPMGSFQSPVAMGGFGTAFVRMVWEQYPQFRGLSMQSDVVTLLQGNDFHPTLGMGWMLIDEYGIPACHIYLHIDDILVSGPNYYKTCAALDWILDCTVRVGLICQPVKTKPPSQIQKMCGFIYDCTGLPTISIPKISS